MAEEPYNPSRVGNPSVLARRNWLQTKLVNFIGKHTPKSPEMVRILSQSMDQPMPLTMRIRKRIHYLICCWCQRYEEQLRYIRDAASKFPEHADEISGHSLPPEPKERIKAKNEGGQSGQPLRFRSGRSMDFIATGQTSRHDHRSETSAQFCLGRLGWKNTLPLCAERTPSYEAEHRRHSAMSGEAVGGDAEPSGR